MNIKWECCPDGVAIEDPRFCLQNRGIWILEFIFFNFISIFYFPDFSDNFSEKLLNGQDVFLIFFWLHRRYHLQLWRLFLISVRRANLRCGEFQ